MSAWAHLPNAQHIDVVLAHAKAHPDKWASTSDASWNAALDAALDAARAAVRGACLALIAWDDAGALMDAPVDAVRTLAAAGHHPAILILPARLAMTEEL